MAEDPRTGTIKVGVVFLYYNEFVMNQNTKDFLTAHYKTQPEYYFDWASYGNANIDIEFFYHPLGMSEKKNNGDCRPHPGRIFDEVEGYDSSTFIVQALERLTTEGCSGGCGASLGVIECTTMYQYINGDEFPLCDTSSTSNICARTFVHEVLHGLGLGYHSNGYGCTDEEIAAFPDTTWRDCDQVEYGSPFDALGGRRLIDYEPMISNGVAAKQRYDLHWIDSNDIIVLKKSDSPSSWTETTRTITISSLDTFSKGTAAIIRFTHESLQGLGLLWLEYRAGNYFDGNVPLQNSGIFAYHEGNVLIDLDPSDDFTHVSLDVGEEWFDPSSGLKLKTLSVSQSSATVRVTFSPPATCTLGQPKLSEGMFGEYRVYLAHSDNLETYQPKDGDNQYSTQQWDPVQYDTTNAQSLSFWETSERYKYKAIFRYEVYLQNTDSASCGDSVLSVRSSTLLNGWTLESFTYWDVPTVGGKGSQPIYFFVAISENTPDGAYEILVEVYNKDTGKVSSEVYRLWICVGGFNPWFFGVDNDRFPSWKCHINNSMIGIEPEPAENPRVPTSSPTPTTSGDDCTDGTLRFKITKNDGRKIMRDCGWVSNKNTVGRCAFDGVSLACRDTCGTC